MKVHLELDSGRRDATIPFHGADHVIASGACPACKASPLVVAGFAGTMVRGWDTYTSEAGCVCCGARIGKLVATVSTVFGIEEDERVLNGRARVY